MEKVVSRELEDALTNYAKGIRKPTRGETARLATQWLREMEKPTDIAATVAAMQALMSLREEMQEGDR